MSASFQLRGDAINSVPDRFTFSQIYAYLRFIELQMTLFLIDEA